MQAYPKLSSVRLLDEIRAAGCTQLKEYVRAVRPRPPEEPVIRFETAPGRGPREEIYRSTERPQPVGLAVQSRHVHGHFPLLHQFAFAGEITQ